MAEDKPLCLIIDFIKVQKASDDKLTSQQNLSAKHG